MSNFQGKFSSAKQEWETPLPLYNKLDSLYNFTIDLAADASNHKHNQFLGPGSEVNEDSFNEDWKGVGWLNPPYGLKTRKLQDWIKRAAVQSELHNSTIVLLIPARTNTKWWHEIIMEKADQIYFIKGRPKFGGATHGLPQPLAVIVFRRQTNIRPHYETLEV